MYALTNRQRPVVKWAFSNPPVAKWAFSYRNAVSGCKTGVLVVKWAFWLQNRLISGKGGGVLGVSLLKESLSS